MQSLPVHQTCVEQLLPWEQLLLTEVAVEYADKDERPKITKPQHVKYSGLLLHFPIVEVPIMETRAL